MIKEKIEMYFPGGVPGLILFIIITIVFWPLAVYIMIAHLLDYRILKSYHFKKQKWSLNICCGYTDGGGVNVDIIKRDVPNFVLVEDIYHLPFKDKEFENTFCSHTIEHIEDPDDFLRELKRVSKNVIFLIPPIWDLASIFAFRQHQWQFLVLKTKYVNCLPYKFELPWGWFRKKLGQTIKA